MNRFLLGLIASLAVLLTACGDPCAGGGRATIRVEVAAPAGGAEFVLTRPDGTEDTTALGNPEDVIRFPDVPSGRWSVRAKPFSLPVGSLIRSTWGAVPDPSSFCVAPGAEQVVRITWSALPAAAHLWVLNGSGGSGSLLSFLGSDIRATTTLPARAKGDSPFGHDLTFDRDGNLWSLGGTTADANIVMTGHMAGTEKKTAERSIVIEGLSCLPGATGLAFDKSGNLWVSAPCANRVYRVTAAQLAQSGTVTPAVTLSNVQAPTGLAFDLAGNLYVADVDQSAVLRYDAASLGVSVTAPSATLVVRRTTNPSDTSRLSASWLAFDGAGNLWADDFGANVIFEIAKADLAASTDLQPVVRITLGVSGLLEGMAFDEGGGLWVAYTAGSLARLSAGQLTMSSAAGMPTVPETVITSSDIGNAGNLAIFPAPIGTPLFHALP